MILLFNKSQLSRHVRGDYDNKYIQDIDLMFLLWNLGHVFGNWEYLFTICSIILEWVLFKVNNRDMTSVSEICSKLATDNRKMILFPDGYSGSGTKQKVWIFVLVATSRYKISVVKHLAEFTKMQIFKIFQNTFCVVDRINLFVRCNFYVSMTNYLLFDCILRLTSAILLRKRL